MQPVSLVWFRQDLRLQDNPALAAAISIGSVLPIYILDDFNSKEWQLGGASRWWLHHSLKSLDRALNNELWVFQGDPLSILQQLISDHDIKNVFWNRCYEPWRITRDKNIHSALKKLDVSVTSHNGSLLWEPWKNLKKDGTPYKVFTPYYKNGVTNLNFELPKHLRHEKIDAIHCSQNPNKIDMLKLLPGINWYKEMDTIWSPGESGAAVKLKTFTDSSLVNYKSGRDFPSLNSVSRLSPHLHFGEVSPRQVLHETKMMTEGLGLENEVEHFQRELAWREFSYSLLFHFPTIPNENLNRSFDHFPWQEDPGKLRAWQKGETGYPLVDAGMRELWKTGYMHNRVRMIVGSFLVKNLLLPWQLGASWFWDCLVDADLANNSSSWQWVAGSGADAAPYFRIFNPVTQSKKFDPEGSYIRKYLPELRNCPSHLIHDPGSAKKEDLENIGIVLGEHYSKPIVELKASREQALSAYKTLKSLS